MIRALASVAAIVLSLFVVRGAVTVHADHNGPWLPSPSWYGVTKTADDFTNWPAQLRSRQRGYVAYCFDSVAAAYPNFRTQARQVVDAATAKTTIPGVEVPYATDGSCDEVLSMPSDSEFVSVCGDGAAGCIQFWQNLVTIRFRRSLGYTDWRSAQCHEGIASGHYMGLHEEYNDRNFTSNGRTYTCMDFGTGVWQTPDWDRDRIWNCWVPDAPSVVHLTTSGGWAAVTWSDTRADGGASHCNNSASPTAPGLAKNTNADVIAYAWSATPSSAPEWIGTWCGAQFNFCTSAYSDAIRWFDPYWRGCLWVRAGNAATWTVPQVSAPNFWTLAGCF